MMKRMTYRAHSKEIEVKVLRGMYDQVLSKKKTVQSGDYTGPIWAKNISPCHPKNQNYLAVSQTKHANNTNTPLCIHCMQFI